MAPRNPDSPNHNPPTLRKRCQEFAQWLSALAVAGMWVNKTYFSPCIFVLLITGAIWLATILRERRFPVKVITGFVFLSPTIIFPAHYFLTTSPATYTIHLYELNKDPLGARYWKGEKNRAIDLTEHPILESDIGPTLYNNGLYNLQPALKHTNDGLTLSDVRLTIRISNALKIKVSDYLPRWNVQVVGNYTEYTTVIPTVTNHDLQPTLREFIFHRSGHESFQITYRITGMDDMGRYLRPPETTVTLTKLE